MRMKILQLCKKFPYPQKDGESIAIANLSKSLTELGCDVHLFAMNTRRHHVDIDALGAEIDHYQQVYAIDVDNTIKPLDALSNLIKRQSYHISRFESDNFKENLVRLLKRETFDVIQLETIYLTPYIDLIREYSNAVVAMRAHNIEHEIWERITENTSFLPKKWYLSHLTRQLKDFEVKNLNKYDLLVAISDADLLKFKNLGYKNGAVSTPVGLEIAKYQNRNGVKDSDVSLSFIGSLDWRPNLEGLMWYVKNVDKLVERGVLHIAGRNTPDAVRKLSSDKIKVHGEVPDARSFIANHEIMIVPLLSGSGMRVKILEGMAMGKIVVTTSKGMEGIDAEDGVNILIADTPEDFASKINWAASNIEEAELIGKNAQTFISQQFDSQEIAKQLLSSYEYVLSDAYVPSR
jgi:glycosyltransferase involved in cell wall biosynthesis